MVINQMQSLTLINQLKLNNNSDNLSVFLLVRLCVKVWKLARYLIIKTNFGWLVGEWQNHHLENIVISAHSVNHSPSCELL